MGLGVLRQSCTMPVPDGINDVKEGSHKNSGHRSHDKVAKCILIRKYNHQDVLDGVQYGVEGVLYPTHCASNLFLNTFLWVIEISISTELTVDYSVIHLLVVDVSCVLFRDHAC